MTTDFPGNGPNFDFSSLSTQEDGGPTGQRIRTELVELAGNFNTPGAAYITANVLELSALGATTDLLGQWGPPEGSGINLVGWHHKAVTGRDVYVKIVVRGWMFPLGHAATMTIISERTVESDPELPRNYGDAYLGQKAYIRVTEPTKKYPALGQPFGTNDWPFQVITITTTTSPLLDPARPHIGSSAQVQQLTSGGDQIPWSLIATDLAGNVLHLQVPLGFVVSADPGNEFDASTVAPWIAAYNKLNASTNRTAYGHGQVMRFAPESPGQPGNTTHPVYSLSLGAASPTKDPTTTSAPPNPPSTTALEAAAQPAFYPVLAESSVHLKAADTLTGSGKGFTDSSGTGVRFQFYGPYVDTWPRSAAILAGDTTPLNGMYGQLTDALPKSAGGLGAGPLMQLPGNLVGGLGTPNTLMSGLSSVTGPVAGDLSDLASIAAGALSPAQYFSSLPSAVASELPQLFGALKLADILDAFSDALPGNLPNVTTAKNAAGDEVITYTLMATLKSAPSANTIFVPDGGDGTGQFLLTATATISANGAVTYDVNGSITPFSVYLVNNGDLEFIQVPFEAFSFSSQSGSKTQVDVSIGSVQFEGAFSFVNALEDFLQDLGGSGISISVTPTQLVASVSLSLPPVGVGVFTLSGLAFGSSVTIPFLGDPAILAFNFASQDNPFLLTIWCFGGGGFFSIGLGFAGVQTIQASFEFAGQLALDLGVASGSITLAAGVYYGYAAPSAPNPGTTLTGFVRLTGEVEVLGIISISAELDLSLSYVSNPSGEYVQGTATLKVSISICFFSITVPITVTKSFAGGGGGGASATDEIVILADDTGTILDGNNVTQVTFLDVVPDPADWQDYCDAFTN
jgi:hypothetical protein